MNSESRFNVTGLDEFPTEGSADQKEELPGTEPYIIPMLGYLTGVRRAVMEIKK